MSAPSPALILETLSSYQRPAALKAAIELAVFTAIAEGNQTAPELAKRCGASERGMRILCDYLTILGFLVKTGRQYALTPDSAAFLDSRSPGYMGGITDFLLHPTFTAAFKDIAAIVRKGGTVMPGDGMTAPEQPMWVEFARAMQPVMAFPADAMAQLVEINPKRKLKVLDVAAGHGLFGLAFARHYPHAQIVALDWPNVLEVAKENALKAGIGDRFSTIEGSAFDMDFGGDYDIVLLANFLHHFDIPACERFLKKVHSCLDEGGRVVTLEFVPNEDRVSPPVPAAFSMMMLGATPSGDAYTFKELESMFRNAGFSSSELHPLPPTFSHAIVSFR